MIKGVSWDKKRRKWRVEITVNKKQIMLDRFPSEMEAAEAYDKKALELFGEFAKPNFKDAANGTKNSAEHTQVSTPSDNPDLLAGV